MGTMVFNTENAYLCDANGNILTKVVDIQEFDATAIVTECDDSYAIGFNKPIEFSTEIIMTRWQVRSMYKFMNPLIYGWKAKGPIRKKKIDALRRYNHAGNKM